MVRANDSIPSDPKKRHKDCAVAMKQIFVELPTVARMLTLSESTVQAMVRLGSGHFPQPRQISVRRVGWLLREIEEWAESRPASDLPPPPNTGARKPRVATQKQQDTPGDQKVA
ncbi:AlpA family phage regulatory protein [Accumulibacter sp.]|uniref:helix-turn-helix transcriptional regulator n=2 Tax=Accumulibacter sp. TaxID=2053492 RepID=UPI0034581CE9